MPPPVLLYDGTCGVCAGSVQFILRHDRHGFLRFAPLQGQFAAAVISRHPQLRAIDSVVWLEPADRDGIEQVAIRSEAALRVVRYLGGGWRWLAVLRLVPRPVRDAAYDLIARHRHRWVREQCLVPTAAERGRFIVD